MKSTMFLVVCLNVILLSMIRGVESQDACSSRGIMCSPNARCILNNLNQPSCVCNDGFQGNGLTCEDVNECLVGNGGCVEGSICLNIPGSRICQCVDNSVSPILSYYPGNQVTQSTCPEGTFGSTTKNCLENGQLVVSQIQCLPCPTMRTSVSGSSFTVSDCFCFPGYFLSSTGSCIADRRTELLVPLVPIARFLFDRVRVDSSLRGNQINIGSATFTETTTTTNNKNYAISLAPRNVVWTSPISLGIKLTASFVFTPSSLPTQAAHVLRIIPSTTDIPSTSVDPFSTTTAAVSLRLDSYGKFTIFFNGSPIGISPRCVLVNRSHSIFVTIANRFIQVFVNGVSVARLSLTFRSGNYHFALGSGVTGSFDEFSVFNEAVDSTNIALYN